MSRAINKRNRVLPVFLLTLMLLSLLTGCSVISEEVAGEVDPQRAAYMTETAKSLFSTIAEVSGTEAEAQAKMVPVLKKGLESFQIAEGDLGTIDMSSIHGESVKATGENTYEVEFQVDGTEHSATVVTMFEEGYSQETKEFYLDPTSMTTNVNFSSGELIGQAGLNTILGMGTTFFVLILLSFVISLFKYINKAQQHLEEQKRLANAPAPEKLVVEKLERIPDEDTDPMFVAATAGALLASGSIDAGAADGNLIAVITAAIASMRADENPKLPPDQFVVKSIKKQKRKAAF